MIKKVLLGLGLSIVGLFGFTNANFQDYGYIGSWRSSSLNNNYSNTVLKNGSFLGSFLGQTFDSYLGGLRVYVFRTYNENYPLYASFSSDYGTAEGYLTQYGICNSFVSNGNIDFYYNVRYNCNFVNFNSGYKTSIINFINTLSAGDQWAVSNNSSDRHGAYGSFCINNSYLNQALCFGNNCGYNESCPVFATNSQNFGDFTNIPSSFINVSPFAGINNITTGNNRTGIELNSVDGSIKYFEELYGFKKDMCYAGIDNLTSLYGDPVSFDIGNGLSIFEVYSGLYGNDNLSGVSKFLQTWLINYVQWYDRNGNPLYLATYNSGTNNIDLYFENLTFPFVNNPVAINFLVSNIYDYLISNNNSPDYYSDMVVSYCNLKINNGTFEDILGSAIKNNINTYIGNSNINDGFNEDGSRRSYDNIDAFLSSGVELAFSGDTTVSNTLKNFFTEFEEVLDLSDINTSTRILPSWLVTAFLFVVLFKLLRRKNG